MKGQIFNRKATVGVFCFLFCCLSLRAADVGTTASNFLKIPVAAIPTSLGNSYTAMIGPDSILYNPAGLGLLTYPVFSGSHNQYLIGISQEYVAATYRTKLGTVGVAYSLLRSGNIKSYDLNENPLGTVSTSHKQAVISFAQSFPHFNQDIGMIDPMVITPGWTNIAVVEDYRPKAYRISFGGSLKYVGEKLADESSSTYTFDLGIMLVLPEHLQLGAAVLNLGGSQKFYSSSAKLPRTIRAGVAKDFHSKKNLMVFTVMSDIVKESDYDLQQSLGFEMSVLNMVQLRLGYKSGKDEGSRLSGGFGMNFDRFTSPENFINGVRLDYSYFDYGVLGATHRFGFQFIWGGGKKA